MLYRIKGKQTSTSFHDFRTAARFQKLVDQVGPAKALQTVNTHLDPSENMTMEEWFQDSRWSR